MYSDLHIDHINVVVHDLETMSAFYRDVLGMRETLRARLEGDWIEAVVGLRGVVADCVYLQPADGPRIELLKYIAPQGSAPEDHDLGNTLGIRHIAFRVADIDAAYNTALAAGVEFIGAPTLVPLANVSQVAGRKRLCYFHDPEGNLLEFCEYK